MHEKCGEKKANTVKRDTKKKLARKFYMHLLMQPAARFISNEIQNNEANERMNSDEQRTKKNGNPIIGSKK